MIPALDLMKTDSAYHFGMEQALNLKELIEEQNSSIEALKDQLSSIENKIK